jgi:hypothetical protein
MFRFHHQVSRGSYARAVPLAAELALDGDPGFGTASGIYGLENLPLKLEREE